jgi:hypothetical protein
MLGIKDYNSFVSAGGAVSNICNHVGGPLGEGRLDGDRQ